MKRLLMGLFVMVAGLVTLTAQTPAGSWITKLDPALDAIVSPTAKLEMLKQDYFGISEGPVWVKDGQSGYLAFSDIGSNNIYKWTPDGKLSVLLEKTGWSGTDTSNLVGYISSFNGHFYTVSFGSNGVALDPQGRLVWTAQGDRAIVRQEKDGKTRTVVADRFEGKRLNRPNDLAIRSDGAVYFTDGGGGDRAGIELDHPGVYLVKDGKVQLIEKEFGPNGIAFSPDEKYLYVSAGRTGGIWRYDLRPDGTVTNRKQFLANGGCDGMKTDQKGNLFCSADGVRIYSPEGKHLGNIIVPIEGGGPTNVAFGDADGKGLFITTRRSLVRIRMNTQGLRP